MNKMINRRNIVSAIVDMCNESPDLVVVVRTPAIKTEYNIGRMAPGSTMTKAIHAKVVRSILKPVINPNIKHVRLFVSHALTNEVILTYLD